MGFCRSSSVGEWYKSDITLRAYFIYKGFKEISSPKADSTKEVGWGKRTYRNTTLCKVNQCQCSATPGPVDAL